MHVTQTDWTVLLEARFFALVVIKHRNRITAATFIAVKLRVSTAYTTYSAFVAVVNFFSFCLIVVKRANSAVVICKVLVAIYAGFRFWLFLFTT